MRRSKTDDCDGPVLVSACLLGLRTRWDGEARRSEAVVELTRGRRVIPICPEQLGGLPTPRAPAEISEGEGGDVLDGRARVIADGGADVTECHLRGARESLKLAELLSARRAILKEGSPACGASRIKRAGRDLPGMGVTAALLQSKGVRLEGID